ncbi:GNAT family N-acetyltransferase [Microbacterium sp. NPDC089698]|uniref:GNAT family N-acetyltransferase n=1 Tax=Microbacterium sp. NPDC089698 TaxID=3364200 RepID=UPI003829E505
MAGIVHRDPTHERRVLHHAGSEGTWMRAVRDAVPLRRPDYLRGPRVHSPLIARTLLTPRLLLRPYTMADAADWFRIQSSPAIREFLPWPARNRRASARHLQHRTRHTRLCYDGDFLALAVTREDSVIGDVSLHLRGTDPLTFGAEIGWLLLPSCTGEGYATEAAAALIDVAFRELGANWIAAVIHEDNHPSLRLAERLGFHFGGRLPDGRYRLVRLR